jgi:hypothetical protein
LILLPVGILKLGFEIGSRIRFNSLTHLCNRSQVIIDAIEGYNRHTGKYPDYLEDLVPIYLPRIPAIHMMGYNKYYYESFNKSNFKKYKLVIDSTRSELIYSPDGDYPEQKSEGVPQIRHIGRWLYIQYPMLD